MDDSLMIIQAAASQIPQRTVLALIIVAGLFVLGLLILLGMFVRRADDPMKYGNFFVVALGITTALMGFLVAFPLLISGVFEDPTQVLAILSALFGAIVGLVGTYFGVKASSDAGERAQNQAATATTQAAQTVQAVAPGPAGGAPAGGAPAGGAPAGGAPAGGAPAGGAPAGGAPAGGAPAGGAPAGGAPAGGGPPHGGGRGWRRLLGR